MSESNPIRIFVTHGFDKSDDYLRVFEFLESVDRFYYVNVSEPDNLPASDGVQAVKDELIRQIKAAETVIVLAALHEQKRDLLRFMMDVAAANHINMVCIKPYGGRTETAAAVASRCAEVVEWNEREMVDAIKRQARGEDTSRWEVIDFPGFDANGPVND